MRVLDLRVGYGINSFIPVYSILYYYNATRSFDQLDAAVFERAGCQPGLQYFINLLDDTLEDWCRLNLLHRPARHSSYSPGTTRLRHYGSWGDGLDRLLGNCSSWRGRPDRFQPGTQIQHQADQTLVLPGLESTFVIQTGAIHTSQTLLLRVRQALKTSTSSASASAFLFDGGRVGGGSGTSFQCTFDQPPNGGTDTENDKI